jgi:hypothetical protein
MRTYINKSCGTLKGSVGRLLGALFVGISLVAIVLNVGLPHRSKAAIETISLRPVAIALVNSKTPDHVNHHVNRLVVRDNPRITSFLRFEVSGLVQGSVAQARLRLVVTKGSEGQPANLKIFNTTPDWNPHTVTWNNQPAFGQQVAAFAAPLEKGQAIEFDLGQALAGDGIYSFALTSDAPGEIRFWSSASRKAPALVLTLQPGVVPDTAVTPDDVAADADVSADDAEADADTSPEAPAPDAAASPSDFAAEAAMEAAMVDDTADTAAPAIDAPVALPESASVTAGTPSPMGCQPGEVFADIQDWWRNPDPAKDHGHLHVSVCFPHGKTLTGKVTFRVRTVMHMNPGVLTRVAIYVVAPNVSGAKTCASNGALACATGLPRSLSKCTTVNGTLTDNGMTCVWWDSLTVDTASVAYDGWQEFRVKGYVKEPDGKEMIVSNGLHAYIKNGHPIHNTDQINRMTGRGWYTNALYANANIDSPPTGPVSGVWRPYVIFNAPSGTPITGYYAALDTDFHNGNPGIPIQSGKSEWRGYLTIDTTKLTNGWHRLFLKSDAFQSNSGSTNSGVLAIFFEVRN